MADIYRAAEAGNLKMLYKWLKNGTSPDSFLKATKATPLIWAARKSHPKAVKLLIRFKATLDMQDVKGNTALHYACQNNDRKTTLLLVEAGANMSKVNERGEAPFQLSSFEFFKKQVIEFFNLRIEDNLIRRKYLDSKIASVNLSLLNMKELCNDNIRKFSEWKWQIEKASDESKEARQEFNATKNQLEIIQNLRKTYLQRMIYAREEEKISREKEAKFRALENIQLEEIRKVEEELKGLKSDTEQINAEVDYLTELMESRTSILGPVEMFPEDERVALLCLTGILALIHADDSEEMEFSLANSDARDHISNAINKFGKKNVGLSRAGNTLINRVNEYEKEFSKFKNADSLNIIKKHCNT